jgi:hypothetical protein
MGRSDNEDDCISRDTSDSKDTRGGYRLTVRLVSKQKRSSEKFINKHHFFVSIFSYFIVAF